ncbi:MAG: diadenylate cyclase CdaA [bacterium]
MLNYLQGIDLKDIVYSIKGLNPVNFIELTFLVIVIFIIYRKIKGSQAEQLLKGILMLFLALILSHVFQLHIIGKVLESIVNIVIFSLVVIFQPELRRLLGYLGQPGIINKNILSPQRDSDTKSIVDEIIEAVKHLSKSHIGALLVFKNVVGNESFLEVGTKLNANVTHELILTIFHPNTPLHDGATVISNDQIVAAGVLLPLTEDPTLSWKYGTRHRAAIGMSEVSDAVCLVVSEETGDISMAQGGLLTKFSNTDELKRELMAVLGCNEDEDKNITLDKNSLTFGLFKHK